MKSDVYQWFKFNPIHWQMGKVQRCSCECQSEFINLCCLWWSRKGEVTLSDAEDRYDYLEEMQKRKIVKIEDDMIVIDFLQEQLDEINELSRKNSERGRLGGLKKAKTTEIQQDNKTEATAKRPLSNRLPNAKPELSESQAKEKRREEKREEKENNTSSIDESDFETFWNAYGKKTGRKKAEAKWKRLKQDDKQQILETVEMYVQSKPDPQYRPNPLTYLNGELWKDEIIMPEPTQAELDSRRAEYIRSRVKTTDVTEEYIDLVYFQQAIYKRHLREAMANDDFPEPAQDVWEDFLKEQTKPIVQLVEEFKQTEEYEHELRCNTPTD